MRKNLIAWQWSGYPEYHRSRANLLLHVLTAPLFPLGCVLLVLAVWNGWLAVAGAIALIVPLVLQGRGHKGEKSPPIPFLGPFDFVSRFFVEQWINLPRFLLSGGWLKAWRAG